MRHLSKINPNHLQSKLELLLIITTETLSCKYITRCHNANIYIHSASWLNGFIKPRGRTASGPLLIQGWTIFSMLHRVQTPHIFHSLFHLMFWLSLGFLCLGFPLTLGELTHLFIQVFPDFPDYLKSFLLCNLTTPCAAFSLMLFPLMQ